MWQAARGASPVLRELWHGGPARRSAASSSSAATPDADIPYSADVSSSAATPDADIPSSAATAATSAWRRAFEQPYEADRYRCRSARSHRHRDLGRDRRG